MTNYTELRQRAIQNTYHHLSKHIIQLCPDIVWHVGANPRSKYGHYTYFYDQSAICCTEQEVLLLRDLRQYFKPFRILEIGSYIGWSTMHLAYKHLGSLTAVDNFSESLHDDRVEETLKANLKAVGIKNVILVKQSSDDFFKTHFVKYDFIFIDGFHRDGQPLKDVQGAVQVLSKQGVIVLHDTWMPGVYDASKYLMQNGFKEFAFETDNRLALYTKEEYPNGLFV